jgi:hypothetical protein
MLLENAAGLTAANSTGTSFARACWPTPFYVR